MGRERKNLSPTYTELIIPTYDALKQLGGSGTNNEIYERVIVNLNLSDEVLDEPHLGSLNQSEVEYQLAWARTYLKNYGIIVNSARSVWSITSEYASELTVSAKEIVAFTVQKNAKKREMAKSNDKPDGKMDKPEDVWNHELDFRQMLALVKGQTQQKLYTEETFECPENWDQQHIDVLINFTNAIAKGEQLIAPGAEGIKAVEIANAMFLSDWLGHAVTIPVDDELFYAKLQEKVQEEKNRK